MLPEVYLFTAVYHICKEKMSRGTALSSIRLIKNSLQKHMIDLYVHVHYIRLYISSLRLSLLFPPPFFFF